MDNIFLFNGNTWLIIGLILIFIELFEGSLVVFLDMVAVGTASVEDILLLFIYLELGAMVGIYFKTNHMPVRFLIYVAITALTRMLIEIVSDVNSPHGEILSVVGSIVLLTLAVLVLRFGSHKFGQVNDEDASDDNDQQQK